MKENKLEVGDKVYQINYQRWGNNTYYNFTNVVRLTNTTAILENEVIVINKAMIDKEDIFFHSKGQNGTWRLVTDRIMEDSEKEALRQNANRWFSANENKFTDEQRLMIYNLFNKSE